MRMTTSSSQIVNVSTCILSFFQFKICMTAVVLQSSRITFSTTQSSFKPETTALLQHSSSDLILIQHWPHVVVFTHYSPHTVAQFIHFPYFLHDHHPKRQKGDLIYIQKCPERDAGQTYVMNKSAAESELHHFGLLGFGFLHRNVHLFMVCAHIVGQPAHCHGVSWKDNIREILRHLVY